MSWKALQQPNWSTFSVGLALQDDPSVLQTMTMKCRVQFHESWWHFHYLPLPTVQTENATKSQLSEDSAESPTNIYELSWEEADEDIFLIREFHECGHNIHASSPKRRTCYVQGPRSHQQPNHPQGKQGCGHCFHGLSPASSAYKFCCHFVW